MSMLRANKVVSALGGDKEGGGGEANANKGTEKKGPEIGLLKFSYDGELTGEIDGPTVTASATTDNSWDFSMTLDRNLESSQDPGIPGRPGDVILGGGFEIVYLKTDTVDIRPNSITEVDGSVVEKKCLEVILEIQWEPRIPTSYVISIFTIEEKILGELHGLVKDLENPNTIVKDVALNNVDIKAVWTQRLKTP